MYVQRGEIESGQGEKRGGEEVRKATGEERMGVLVPLSGFRRSVEAGEVGEALKGLIPSPRSYPAPSHLAGC